MKSPSIIRGFYSKSNKKSGILDSAQTPSGSNSPKMFKYPEIFETRNCLKAFPKSPNNMAKLLTNLHSKFKKKKIDLPLPPKAQNTPKKIQTPTFIEKIRLELEAKFPKSKIHHGRSLSQTKHHKKFTKSEKNTEKTLKDYNSGTNYLYINNFNKRKDSLPECSIDFQRLDLPYAHNYIKGLYYKPMPILSYPEDI